MNLIEAVLNIAPDRGSGLLELGLLVVGSAVLTAFVAIRKTRSSRRDCSRQ